MIEWRKQDVRLWRNADDLFSTKTKWSDQVSEKMVFSRWPLPVYLYRPYIFKETAHPFKL